MPPKPKRKREEADDKQIEKANDEVEQSEMEIGKGEACSWCGEEEHESRT